MINTGHSSLKQAHSATPCTVFPNPICRQLGPAIVYLQDCSLLSITVLHGRLAALIVKFRIRTTQAWFSAGSRVLPFLPQSGLQPTCCCQPVLHTSALQQAIPRVSSLSQSRHQAVRKADLIPNESPPAAAEGKQDALALEGHQLLLQLLRQPPKSLALIGLLACRLQRDMSCAGQLCLVL